MAEIIQKDGTWVFDGDALRLTPGRDKNVSLLRKELGELLVPLAALAGISFEQGKKSGRLRLRLRDGSDPLLHATGGRLAEPHDPYQLLVESDRYGVAEYFVDEVRNALLLDQVPSDPVDAYLLPGPAVPLSVSAGDGVASFDGERVRLEWKWQAEDSKSAAGPRTLPLGDIVGVEWQPTVGLENGHLRFTVRAAPSKVPPKYDPNAVELWGFKKDPLMALVAAAVQARLPHPSAPVAVEEEAAPAGDAPAPAPVAEDDHDALLRRLRELGELHRSGVLTDEEFTLAKQAVLKRM
ncbi:MULTISPECIES: DUF4429 domain-containing protein [Streptomyces]|uniref:DUF4429 domain-containing protein n=1 Tax=Streptomyces olivaceus TaxID=47716 RepID=A0ABS7W4U8_STROV|nr:MULTISPECIES: DUF4429 domain-containing protein [Streptomyces]AOW87136.1 Tat pathway signal sequence domain protein [Streptomyces olivaceus]MBZ6090592.1 DUF4429 domain-containing protein [Streptomyces olivaceus]MBZ6096768.1 DUF4429 domain-containing protein [Streptomyces olivaceus]MBZ6104867.1 DUF4429 domain-containing protein [Streptomyces olivaceus]MBZ6112597.1 DUF4429 domain-containing protein [Streptomyces olivaceus]